MTLAMGLGKEVVVSFWSLAATRPGAAKFRGKAASPAHTASAKATESGMAVLCFFPEGRKEMGKQETQKDALEILGLWTQTFLWQLHCKEINLPAAGGTRLNIEQTKGVEGKIFDFLLW